MHRVRAWSSSSGMGRSTYSSFDEEDAEGTGSNAAPPRKQVVVWFSAQAPAASASSLGKRRGFYRVCFESRAAAGLRRFEVLRRERDMRALAKKLGQLRELSGRIPPFPGRRGSFLAKLSLPKGSGSATPVADEDPDEDDTVQSPQAQALRNWLQAVAEVAWDTDAMRKFAGREDDDEVLRAEAAAEVEHDRREFGLHDP